MPSAEAIHYLGKETVQNLLAFRFANALFEPIWDRRYVDHVAITVSEELGVEHRGGYYDQAGALSARATDDADARRNQARHADLHPAGAARAWRGEGLDHRFAGMLVHGLIQRLQKKADADQPTAGRLKTVAMSLSVA